MNSYPAIAILHTPKLEGGLPLRRYGRFPLSRAAATGPNNSFKPELGILVVGLLGVVAGNAAEDVGAIVEGDQHGAVVLGAEP